ncbi:MAG: hypothetical protein R3E79_52855 [Caldilineaceae bacterium]
MTPLDIRLFGAIEIRHQGTLLTDFRSQKALALLAYLICQDRPVTPRTSGRAGLAGDGAEPGIGPAAPHAPRLDQQAAGVPGGGSAYVTFSRRRR